LAHRFAYEQFIGPIPSGLTVDHLCFERRCVNPGHLEAVTNEENARRGQVRRWANTAARLRAVPSTCSKGHAFNSANTILEPSGKRHCRTCRESTLARLRAGEPPKHGVINAYYRYGCRCHDCKAARNEYDRARRRRIKATA